MAKKKVVVLMKVGKEVYRVGIHPSCLKKARKGIFRTCRTKVTKVK